MKKIRINVKPLQLVVGIILVIYSAILLSLFLWALINSFKSSLGFDLDPVGLPKKRFTDFQNYIKALDAIRMKAVINHTEYWVKLPEMFFNTVLYALGCAFFETITPCLVAYVTSKYKFKFNRVVYMTVIFVMVTPIIGSLPSQVQMAKALNLFDSHLGLWFMSMTFLGTYYLVFYSVFKSLSWEYAEAALTDGANHATILFRIMLPLVKNTVIVVLLLNFISRWNDYQTSWIFLPNKPTAAVGVQYFSFGSDIRYKGIPIKIAGSLTLLTPVLILFIAFRKKLVENLTIGGIKG